MMSDPEGRQGPHGPGHASFIHERSGSGRVYCVFHATGAPTDGWANRKAYVCTLDPEVFIGLTDPLICGAGLPGVGGGDGIFDYPEPERAGSGKTSMLDKIKDKVKTKLREL